MSQVIISSNLKKKSVRIDAYGNEIDPKTKQIVKANVPDYVPTKEEIEAKINAPKEPVKVPEEIKKLNPLAELIKKQVKEQIQSTVKEMVEEALKEAFK